MCISQRSYWHSCHQVGVGWWLQQLGEDVHCNGGDIIFAKHVILSVQYTSPLKLPNRFGWNFVRGRGWRSVPDTVSCIMARTASRARGRGRRSVPDTVSCIMARTASRAVDRVTFFSWQLLSLISFVRRRLLLATLKLGVKKHLLHIYSLYGSTVVSIPWARYCQSCQGCWILIINRPGSRHCHLAVNTVLYVKECLIVNVWVVIFILTC